MKIDAWSGGRPQTFRELFDFYHNYVKLLYAHVQTENRLPTELLFEQNAALDHVARHWIYGEDEKEAVAKAFSHFKRGCLDVFKITFRETLDLAAKLDQIDTSVIDNGQFDQRLHQELVDIKRLAREARQREGQGDKDDKIPAFEYWQPVFIRCLEFEQEFWLNANVEWARRRTNLRIAGSTVATFLAGVLASAVVAYVAREDASYLDWLIGATIFGLFLCGVWPLLQRLLSRRTSRR